MSRGHERPEQHGGSFGAGQYGLRLDSALERHVKAHVAHAPADYFACALCNAAPVR